VSERLDEVDAALERQRLESFLESREVDDTDPLALAELLRGYVRIVYGDPEATNEDHELAALLETENYDELDRRIAATAPEARARSLWRLMQVMDRQTFALATDLMVAAQNRNAANIAAPSATIARWQELVHVWSEREPLLVREALDTRANKLSSILELWEVLRGMFVASDGQEDESSIAEEQAITQALAPLGEMVQDRWFLPLLTEIAPSFEQSRADQISALQAAMLQRCQAENPSPYQLSVLSFPLLDTASLTPRRRLQQEVLDCMWATFGREAPHQDYWTGVAITRGLMLIANDNRVLEINRALLANVGGDPPWMLVILQRLGRPQEALSDELGPGAQNWQRLVARYTPPAR
jgi:hypothetical protein